MINAYFSIAVISAADTDPSLAMFYNYAKVNQDERFYHILTLQIQQFRQRRHAHSGDIQYNIPQKSLLLFHFLPFFPIKVLVIVYCGKIKFAVSNFKERKKREKILEAAVGSDL